MDPTLPRIHAEMTAPQYFREFVDGAESVGEVDDFANMTDRMVRNLFDIGMQLHSLRPIFEQPQRTGPELRAAGATLTALLENLDLLICEAGLAALGCQRSLGRT